MTADEFHCRLLALVKQANRANLCAGCVVLELVSACQGVALQAGLSSLDLTLHGIPQQLFEPVEEPQQHHLH